MLLFAATTVPAPATTLDKLREIPMDFWLKLGAAVIALIVVVVLLRKVAKMNKVVLTVVVFFLVTVVGFNWIYERSEPAWATPVVSFLSGFLPTKGPPLKTTTPPPALKKKA